MSVEPGTICPSCERKVPVPEEDREPKETGQVNLTFPSKAEAESFRDLIALGRERIGAKGRVQAGPIAHALVYAGLTGNTIEAK